MTKHLHAESNDIINESNDSYWRLYQDDQAFTNLIKKKPQISQTHKLL